MILVPLDNTTNAIEMGCLPGWIIGKCLLNFNYRMKYLEDVLAKANLYLHSGEAAVEHAELVKAIEIAEKASMAPGQEDKGMHPW